MPFKDFVNGAVLTESDLDVYLMAQTVMTFASSADRTSSGLTPAEGMVSYLEDTNGFEIYNAGAWREVFVVLSGNGAYVEQLGVNSTPDASFRATVDAGGSSALLLKADGTAIRFDTATADDCGRVFVTDAGLWLDGRGTDDRLHFRTGGTTRGMFKSGGKLVLAGTGDSLTQGEATRLEIEDSAGAFPLVRINNDIDVDTGSRRVLALGIGSDSSNPGTNDAWVTFSKGNNTTLGAIEGTGGASVAYATTSDGRLKDVLSPLEDHRDVGQIFDGVAPVWFCWKDSEYEQGGFIAQDVMTLVPEAVHGDPDGPLSEPLTMAVGELVPYLWAEVRALRARVAQLENATP